jgi:crotonobetainyl-CoA:carnitine CoA-transferase CaiB-like acyl-CoA transferase
MCDHFWIGPVGRRRSNGKGAPTMGERAVRRDEVAGAAPSDRPGPLDDLRVVDLTDLRGALCSRILADLGADVVHVEPPTTDGSAPLAHRPAFTTAHRYRNANKRGAAIDPSTAEGRDRLDDLLATADVFVDNLPLDRRVQLGLDPDAVAARHPHLVHVALTDLGLTGPRSRWHLEALPALASSGALHATGFPALPPCSVPGYLAHDCGSVHGALGAIAAVMQRARDGMGQLVEVSAQEAALGGLIPWSIPIADYVHINPMFPVEGRRNAEGVYWVLPAKDGWVRTVIGSARQWDGFVSLLGSPDALTGPEWNQPGFRLMNGDVVRLVAEECLRDRTRAELFDEALGTGATVGVLQTPLEFVDHPQTRSRGAFAATGFPGLGDAPFARFPVTASETPASLRRPAPEPGDDVSAGPFERRADRQADPPIRPRNGRSPGNGLLLDGIKVVEFGVAAVVPELCGQLSELGADVVKIESVAHPDVLRQTGGTRINCGFAFNAECRGRRSIALDLSTDEGRALALELCARADIVAENHRGGVLDRLGLGYDDVRARNPDVIYVSSQGYGRTGPLAEMPAYGPLNAGFAGVHLLWNHPEAPYPCGTSMNHPDHIAGKLLAVAVLAAIRHRDRTGAGQLLDMAQTEAAAYLVGEVYLQAALDGADPSPVGNRDDRFAPHGVYPSAGDDRWIAIVVTDDAAWHALAELAGLPHDPAFADLAGRVAGRELIDERLSQWTASRDAIDAAAALQAAGVSAMPVMGPLDHRADEHLAERGALPRLEHPEVGAEQHAGNPVRYGRLATRTAASAPCLGAHTVEVLGEALGITAGEVEDLVARGICR